MKRFSMWHTIAVCATVTLLAGCGGSRSQIGASGAMPSMPMAAPAVAARQSPPDSSALPSAAGPNLYVGNITDDVTVYAPGSAKPLRTISTSAHALAVRSGNLYVAKANGVVLYLRIYKNGKTLIRIIKKGLRGPVAMAFGSSGNLFVANISGSNVTAYAPSSGTLLRTISNGVDNSRALGFDASGDLYVGNQRSVTIYAPSMGRPLRTITFVHELLSLALDTSGDLYVGTTHDVLVYAKIGTKLLRSVPAGFAYALAFDGSGNLYVANELFNTVTVYAPNSDKLLQTISKGVTEPRALAFGP